VDLRVGDRMSVCRGLMEPIALWIKEKKEWAIVHRCTRCGFIRTNRIAPDDSVPELLKLARRPYENLPFRIEAGEPLPAAGSCGKKEAI
jgi:hypothetical protein